MRAYSNNGLDFKDCLEPDNLTDGWVYFEHIPSEQELAKAFPEYMDNKNNKLAKSLEAALDAHIDSVARSYRYDSIRTMVTYATSDNLQFGAEGRAAVKFRDACYVKAIQIQDAVQAGQRDIPTEAELISEMPTFESFLE